LTHQTGEFGASLSNSHRTWCIRWNRNAKK